MVVKVRSVVRVVDDGFCKVCDDGGEGLCCVEVVVMLVMKAAGQENI